VSSPPLAIVRAGPQGLAPRSGCNLRSLVVVAGGGRDLDWSPTRVAIALKAHTHGLVVHRLFHGGARGADQAINAAAHRLGWAVEVLRPDWGRYGLGAGPVRNGQLLRSACEVASTVPSGAPAGVVVIAFPGHRGTASLMEQARRLQARCPLPIELIQVDP
jgi:hypothetical protein